MACCGWMLAVSPSFANRGISAGFSIWACSMEPWACVLAAALSTMVFASSPMAWHAMANLWHVAPWKYVSIWSGA